MASYKPKVYLQVDGGSLSDVLDWFITADCPFDVRDINYPDDVVKSVHSTVKDQSREIELLLSRTEKLEKALEEQISRADAAEQEVVELRSPSSRRAPPHFRLPDERPSVTHAFQIGLSSLGKGQITAGYYPGTKDVGEIFIKMSPTEDSLDLNKLKQQVSDLTWFLKGILDQLAIAVSIGLQRGIPLRVYVSKFRHTKFTPDGVTSNKKIPRCTSIVDYLFQWLSMKFDA